MKKFLFLIMVFVMSANFYSQTKHALTVDDIWNMKRIGSFSISPDGNRIIFDATVYNFDENKGATNLWMINTDGTEQKQISDSKKSISSPQFVSDKIICSKGDQLYQLSSKDTIKQKLTDFYSGINDAEFSPSGKQILFSSKVYAECKTQGCNKQKDEERKNSKVKAEIFTGLLYRHWNDWRGPKFSHLFLYDMDSKKYTDLTEGLKTDVPPIALGSSNDYSFSLDGKEIAFTMNQSDVVATSTNNDVFIMNVNDIKDGEPTPFKKISNSEGNDNQPVYSPDGKYIAFCSMERAGFEADKQRIMLYDRSSGNLTNLSSDIDLSAGELIWSQDSKFIYFTAAHHIYNSIYKIEISTHELFTIAEKVVAASITLSPDGLKIYFKNQKSNLPYEIFSVDFDGANLTQITHINAELLSNIEMIPIETFWSDGAEGAKVQSILVKPPFFDSSKKYPFIFLIHGGPQGHWVNDFHYRWNIQMFAAKGYVVVAPNPRGSTGYGQKFTDEISRDWGGKVYNDLMNAYDYAVKNYSFIDSKNTFAAGASFGGYMINWIEGHTDRFNALVCHDGVYDLTSMYGSTDELWFPEWEYNGTPWENKAMYEKWSPNMFVKNFKTPMLIVHGAFDFRVPFSQAMELFTALQKMNVKSKMLYFPDETHFVTKPQNAKLWWKTIFDWFNEFKK